MLIDTGHLRKWFPDFTGISDTYPLLSICYGHSDSLQKGLFIPSGSSDTELRDAISHGAVAAIWEKNRSVPPSTPNHFPLFYCETIEQGVVHLLKNYIELGKLEREMDAKMTKIVQINRIIHNDEIDSYDKAIRNEILHLMAKLPEDVVERGGI